MLCTILYLKNSDKAIFSDLKKRVDNDYILNKAAYPRTVTTIQRLILNYQPNYNYNSHHQSNGVSNQLMFAQCRKTGDDECEKNTRIRNPKETLTTPPATKVEKKDTMWGATSALHKQTQRGFISIQKNESRNIWEQDP